MSLRCDSVADSSAGMTIKARSSTVARPMSCFSFGLRVNVARACCSVRSVVFTSLPSLEYEE